MIFGKLFVNFRSIKTIKMKVLEFSEKYLICGGMYWPQKMERKQRSRKLITNCFFLMCPNLIVFLSLMFLWRNPESSISDLSAAVQTFTGCICQFGTYVSLITNIQIIRQLHDELQLIIDNGKFNFFPLENE